jgi:hypothetical protein
VFTYRNGATRLGLYGSETTLKPSNVQRDSFGKLFDYSVDGFVYAQPLYMEDVAIEGKGINDVIFVATEKDHVYAFDASGSSTAALWHRALADATEGVTPISADDVKTHNTGPWVGITGTPAIDPTSSTLYLVAATKEDGRFVQRLHALDLQSGAEKFGGPVEIKASIPGKGNSNDGNGNVVFSPQWQNQRPALLVTNGKVFIGWARTTPTVSGTAGSWAMTPKRYARPECL